MQFEDLKKIHLILASKSPRRQYLIKELGLNFEVCIKDVDESFPANLVAQQIPLYLCEKKANAFEEELTNNTIVITADTIVWIENQVLNKPENYDDAVRMLKLLSGKMHEVFTGVCLRSKNKTKSFYAVTKVYFKELSDQEIEYYINNFSPYDKAGAYGAQEWIGYIAVEKIEGSYFNVMGLPIRELYEELLKF
ncbi:MAG: septum formation protein Maf [Bacteroidetes bacterium RIFCSPLOWO2_12_FULL_35_15]|nr:MAG: septum formation protein Maf [Bacteroidetes bacterium RIFCSPLOWO2_12_FULL_35_15]